MIRGASKEELPLTVIAIILLASVVIISCGILFYRSQKNKIIYEKQNELTAIASLKIREIENWRKEHIRDGEILQSIIPRNQLINNFLNNNDSGDKGIELMERMKIFISNSDYNSMLLVDTAGSVKLTYPPSVKTQALNFTGNFKINEISLSDLHYSDDLPGKIHIDLQVPLFAAFGNKQMKFGTILLRIDPEKILYPLILSWPTPSKSSETLVARREGDSVLFLNELRHKDSTALRLKLPMNKDLPTSRAVEGYTGVFEGVDYRGIPVIAYLNKIPDSPWYMVAKVDKKEIYSSLITTVFIVITVTILLVILIAITVFYLWRAQRMRYLKELNYTKDKFFSIISHDLRNPFTSIKGFADLLIQKDNLTDKETKNYAEIISSSSQNAVDLLMNLTEWSRLQTNRISFNPGIIDLVSLINDEIELAKYSAMQKSISINIEVPQELRIFADRDMISLVLRNLLSNSIKFSFPGGKIIVSGFKKDNELKVSICDFGIGMKKEVVDKLSKIEEIETTPGTKNEKGSGLGLILVKEFISLHGGRVLLESEEGKCTKFSFTLPV